MSIAIYMLLLLLLSRLRLRLRLRLLLLLFFFFFFFLIFFFFFFLILFLFLFLFLYLLLVIDHVHALVLGREVLRTHVAFSFTWWPSPCTAHMSGSQGGKGHGPWSSLCVPVRIAGVAPPRGGFPCKPTSKNGCLKTHRHRRR